MKSDEHFKELRKLMTLFYLALMQLVIICSQGRIR
jgi:hypothetical protein